ncbi:MAG: STAS domain-containing protein [Betaproteobacteria bacterium]|nr:STAS domain-containing protein [Betaproteobacteria bacterium]
MISCVDGRCTVTGAITIANVAALVNEAGGLLSADDITVDLSGVTEVDSAAVSLLLEWRRQALRAKRTIRFSNIPANLKSLATVYGVSELLGEG